MLFEIRSGATKPEGAPIPGYVLRVGLNGALNVFLFRCAAIPGKFQPGAHGLQGSA